MPRFSPKRLLKASRPDSWKKFSKTPFFESFCEISARENLKFPAYVKLFAKLRKLHIEEIEKRSKRNSDQAVAQAKKILKQFLEEQKVTQPVDEGDLYTQLATEKLIPDPTKELIFTEGENWQKHRSMMVYDMCVSNLGLWFPSWKAVMLREIYDTLKELKPEEAVFKLEFKPLYPYLDKEQLNALVDIFLKLSLDQTEEVKKRFCRKFATLCADAEGYRLGYTAEVEKKTIGEDGQETTEIVKEPRWLKNFDFFSEVDNVIEVFEKGDARYKKMVEYFAVFLEMETDEDGHIIVEDEDDDEDDDYANSTDTSSLEEYESEHSDVGEDSKSELNSDSDSDSDSD